MRTYLPRREVLDTGSDAEAVAIGRVDLLAAPGSAAGDVAGNRRSVSYRGVVVELRLDLHAAQLGDALLQIGGDARELSHVSC